MCVCVCVCVCMFAYIYIYIYIYILNSIDSTIFVNFVSAHTYCLTRDEHDLSKN